MNIVLLLRIIALAMVSTVVVVRAKADIIISLGIIVIAVVCTTIGITATELRYTNKPKTMTINYEFRDSVYVPIDTVINNN